MATAQPQVRRPAAGPAALTVRTWLRKNLFSTWWNGLLTILLTWMLYRAGGGLLRWAVATADWGVVVENFRVLMVGLYPEEQLWRVWCVVGTVALLAGLSWAVWGRWNPRAAAVTALVILALIALPLAPRSRLGLAAAGLLLFAGFALGRRLPRIRRWLWLLWVLAYPGTLVLLGGWAGSAWLPPVSPQRWGGLMLNIFLAVTGIVASFPLGVLLALGRRSRLPAIRLVSIAYIEAVRGVPLITVLFMASHLPTLFLPPGVRLDTLFWAALGIALFSAAYLAENVRGGLQAVPRGQVEAAMALGLRGHLIVGLVVLPQALRAVIPALVGQFISLYKDTTLVEFIGLREMVGIGYAVLAQGKYLGHDAEIYGFAGLVFWALCYTMSYVARRLERRLGVGER